MVHVQLRQVSQYEGSLILDQPYQPFYSRVLLPLTQGICLYLLARQPKVHLWHCLWGLTL